MSNRDIDDAVSLDITDIMDKKSRNSVSRAIRIEEQRLRDMEQYIDKAKKSLEKRVISNKIKYYISLQRMNMRKRCIDFGYCRQVSLEPLPRDSKMASHDVTRVYKMTPDDVMQTIQEDE